MAKNIVVCCDGTGNEFSCERHLFDRSHPGLVASIWQDIRKTDRNKRETLGSRTDTNRGSSTCALGESESGQQRQGGDHAQETDTVSGCPQEDRSRATCSMGQSEGGEEGGVGALRAKELYLSPQTSHFY